MGFTVLRGDEHEWEERPGPVGAPPRRFTDVTTRAGLRESRARVWRLPPRTRGRRHKELAQEEVFVVLAGTLTMLLGEPPERLDLPAGSVVAVEPDTGIQLRNEHDADEAVVFAYGAPPVAGRAEYLDDVEL
jgi:quercetin dioxygenase-like cupin family protein